MTKPTSCHYISVPISHHFLCLVCTTRIESIHFTRGGHSYAVCSSTCQRIQHVFMFTVAFLAGSKVKASFGQSIYSQDNLCESLIRGVTDSPTRVKWSRQKLLSQSILDLNHGDSCGWADTVHCDHPLFHLWE